MLMRVVDVMLAIPALLLALAIVTAIGFGTIHVAIAVGIAMIPGFARITRAEVLRVRNLAVCGGRPHLRSALEPRALCGTCSPTRGNRSRC